jgi:hypothetical protein
MIFSFDCWFFGMGTPSPWELNTVEILQIQLSPGIPCLVTVINSEWLIFSYLSFLLSLHYVATVTLPHHITPLSIRTVSLSA